jgi:5-methylcytosine-specific restriction endonuclease McrA
MNRWGIPDRDEAEIRRRDKRCVYCHVKMKAHPKARGVPGDKITWEHINNSDLNPKHRINIVLCCGQCNNSKGAKKLLEWFESDYCKKRNINEKTVSRAVKDWLRHYKPRSS